MYNVCIIMDVFYIRCHIYLYILGKCNFGICITLISIQFMSFLFFKDIICQKVYKWGRGRQREEQTPH